MTYMDSRRSRTPANKQSSLAVAGFCIVVIMAVSGCVSGQNRSVPDPPVKSTSVPVDPAAVRPETPPTTRGGGGTTARPPLNALEQKIVGALSMLGIEGVPAELNFESAAIGAVFDDGSELYIGGFRTGTDGGDFIVRSERRIKGLVVLNVSYPSTSDFRERFDCGGITYEIQGGTPPGFGDIDDFLEGMIDKLGCR